MADKIVEQQDEGRAGWGTTVAFDAYLKRVSEYKIPTQGLLFVNIATLVRNTAEKNSTVADVVTKTCKFMENMSVDFAGAMSRWREYPHHIVFYYADAMQIVHTAYRREHKSEAALVALEATKELCKRFRDYEPQVHDNTTGHIVLARDVKQPSYKGIVYIANSIARHSTVIHMISHMPIDYHISRLGHLGIMYRSYTGTAVELQPIPLGEVVFEMKGIPFYPMTHMALGDKSCIKGYLLRGQKQEFIKQALRERLTLRSESQINAFVKKFMITLPYTLS